MRTSKTFSRLFVLMLACVSVIAAHAQQPVVPGVETPKTLGEGLPIGSVVIIIQEGAQERLADSLELSAFTKAFHLRPGSPFRRTVADAAMDRVRAVPEVASASYVLLNTELSGTVTLAVKVRMKAPGEAPTPAPAGAEFPDLVKTEHTRVLALLNSGVGLFNDVNAFFGQGPAFTQGNPVADDPAGYGVRFWGEAFLEPGVAAIFTLANGHVQPYGAISYMATGRNTSDIYSKDEVLFGAVERAYAGVYLPKLGKNEELSIDLSYGRQFFQLRDGFLFSRFSGSANAGDRGSLFLNARTTFARSAQAKIQYKGFTAQGFLLQPQELFPDKGNNRTFAGGDINFANNTGIDAGLAYIAVPSSKGNYGIPEGTISQQGMYIINPKLWLSDIGGTGAFLRGEYAHQGHQKADMQSVAWYAAVGLKKKAWKGTPSLMYRYAFMQGDDASTPTYERFDPILTGGLGNWVQGINFRKVNGNGNIISHRVELKGYVGGAQLSLDLFLLAAQTSENRGGLAPISQLNALDYGSEVTFTAQWPINKRLLLLGVLSHAEPGDAIREAFTTEVRAWTTYQCALFYSI